MCINLSGGQIDFFHFYLYMRNGSLFIASGQNCPVQQFKNFLLLLLTYKMSKYKMLEKDKQ